ncbi:DUF6355 family natural product biosynthesis protein [Streptosporangium sp. NPDC050855]|uniref:DUF6355 family natural product biosynthesis protein n=1 Tax=Streptosporangium sp. NPDC050855 TaxID=3366194 RepID=UPI003787783A
MRAKILAAIGGTLAALALTAAPASAGTTATPGSTAGVGTLACGWDPRGAVAYYNHCNTDWVLIRVERTFERPGYDQCVRPGVTTLGMLYDIKYAWAKGPC